MKRKVLLKERAKRDAGIAKALGHANRVLTTWAEDARIYLEDYLKAGDRKFFTCSLAREWAEQHGCPEPPSRRAWGGVMVGACNDGLIDKAGYGTAYYPDRDNSHMTPATLWAAAAE